VALRLPLICALLLRLVLVVITVHTSSECCGHTQSCSVQICALPCSSYRVGVVDVLMLSPPACTGLSRATLYTVAGHLLVSCGVGVHCVQPEPHWRMR
jgi:hypothetical protein